MEQHDQPRSEASLAEKEQRWLRDVYRGGRLREMSLRAMALGALLAVLMITLNIYMGLKTTFAEGGALIACIVGFAVMKALGLVDRKRDPYTPLELNVTQTVAGAAGSLGDIANVIPALFVLGGFTGAAVILYRPGGVPLIPTWWEIVLWCLFTSMLGVSFAVPLRKQLVVADELRFPTGTAAAETIKMMFDKGDAALRQARALAAVAAGSLLVTFLRDWRPASWFGDRPELTRWIRIHSYYTPESLAGLFGSWTPVLFGCPLGALTLGVYVSPMLLGAGFLIGPRVGLSLVLGAVAVSDVGGAMFEPGEGEADEPDLSELVRMARSALFVNGERGTDPPEELKG